MPGIDARLIEQMRDAFAALPDPMRTVFLHVVDGLDYAEIASRLVIDIAEVERLFAEAIIAINRRLAEDDIADKRPGNGANRVSTLLHRCKRRLGFR